MVPFNVLAESQWWWILVIVGVFGLIVLLVIFLKKKFKIFQDEEPAKKTDKEIAAEEVNRLVVDVEEPLESKKDDEE